MRVVWSMMLVGLLVAGFSDILMPFDFNVPPPAFIYMWLIFNFIFQHLFLLLSYMISNNLLIKNNIQKKKNTKSIGMVWYFGRCIFKQYSEVRQSSMSFELPCY